MSERDIYDPLNDEEGDDLPGPDETDEETEY